jgi:hypothetical protein
MIVKNVGFKRFAWLEGAGILNHARHGFLLTSGASYKENSARVILN